MSYRFLVTCATGDIGKELCLHLATKGHDLIITARDNEKIKALHDNIVRQFPQCKVDYFSADLGKPETMVEIIAQAKSLGIDGVVLMPPRPPMMPFEPMEQFNTLNKAMQDCVSGPRYLLQQLFPCMEKSDLKSVIVVSGTSSKQAISNPDWEAFNEVRMAWVGCVKSLADTQGPNGFRFNTVSPGQVLTPTYVKKLEREADTMTKQYEEVLREKAASTPLRKLASIQGVVKTIYFFLKSTGANEITANNIHVDGGTIRPYY
ncbi:SDR family oxidoreductase [Candidatus Berkiella aquae]|uniref:D-beta-hydroxybutyrate dehydrogenase n=1 Tax=Candidatus Berkiella aquae TaxID=295108 RepID=A0A0Q9YM13_9GAMM|nr:SDR family oxidoreductase [Candidatus Berkiella aquae]MCS5710536.1 SDR family oxidoreductase [Candidatus Berkiella aquae]